MLSRFVSIGVLLCTMLASNAAEAQPLVDSIPNIAVCQVPETSLIQDVAVMWLYVVKERQTQKLAFSAADLTRMPVIAVDGYVNGVVLLSTSALNLSVNRRPMNPIRTDADGLFKLKYFGYFSSDDFWSTFLPAEAERTRVQRIQGRYSCFPKVPGDSLSEAPEFRITFSRNNTAHNLTIRQDARIKLDASHATVLDNAAPEFYYLGNDMSRFDDAPTVFNERMHAILSGIQAAENALDRRLVRRVHLIDFDGPHNAYTSEGENEIWFYSKVFWNESLEELQIMAEHETMHILADHLNLPTSSRIRELFARLMGLGTFSRERFYVMATGRMPVANKTRAVASDASILFDFINEKNFIRGMNGGHSQDNLNEFCASFLHTLMYIDRLEPLLSQPVKCRNGSFRTLTADQKAQLLGDYRHVLATMIEEMPGQLPGSQIDLFQACLDAADRVGQAFTTRHATSDGAAQRS